MNGDSICMRWIGACWKSFEPFALNDEPLLVSTDEFPASSPSGV